MKGKLLIIFRSVHGYVKRYVDILGNALGCDAVPAEKLKGNMLAGYDKFLFIGPVHGTQIAGFKSISEYLDIIADKLAVCGVGLLPFAEGMCERLKEGTVSVSYEKLVPVFYAQGGFDMRELSRTERMSFNMIIRQIRIQNVVSDADTAFINASATPLDEVSQKHIQPLVDFLDDKPVDEKLYAPAEITDEEEKKAYLDKSDETDSEQSDDKARELKKKLKK